MAVGVSGNDLIIYYGQLKPDKTSDNSVTIKNYFVDPSKCSIDNIVFEGVFYINSNGQIYLNNMGSSSVFAAIDYSYTMNFETAIHSFIDPIIGDLNNTNELIDTPFNDTIYGGNLSDTITSSTGNDKIYAKADDDVIKITGSGNKFIYIDANDGNDTISGTDKASSVNLVYDEKYTHISGYSRNGNDLIIDYYQDDANIYSAEKITSGTFYYKYDENGNKIYVTSKEIIGQKNANVDLNTIYIDQYGGIYNYAKEGTVNVADNKLYLYKINNKPYYTLNSSTTPISKTYMSNVDGTLSNTYNAAYNQPIDPSALWEFTYNGTTYYTTVSANGVQGVASELRYCFLDNATGKVVTTSSSTTTYINTLGDSLYKYVYKSGASKQGYGYIATETPTLKNYALKNGKLVFITSDNSSSLQSYKINQSNIYTNADYSSFSLSKTSEYSIAISTSEYFYQNSELIKISDVTISKINQANYRYASGQVIPANTVISLVDTTGKVSIDSRMVSSDTVISAVPNLYITPGGTYTTTASYIYTPTVNWSSDPNFYIIKYTIDGIDYYTDSDTYGNLFDEETSRIIAPIDTQLANGQTTIKDFFTSTNANVSIKSYNDNYESVKTNLNGNIEISYGDAKLTTNQKIDGYSKKSVYDFTEIYNGGLGNDTIYGYGGNDSIEGGNGNDVIYAGSGNDTIIGGNDHDKLYGESGDNVFKFSIGDGNDTIYSQTPPKGGVVGTDTICFSDNLTYNNLSFEPNGNDLVIRYGISTKNDSITISGYIKNPEASSVKYITDNNGNNILNDKTILEYLRTEYQLQFDYSTASNKLKIPGTSLNDSINGGSNNDTIYGYAGNDVIYGDNGNDVIYGGNDDDYICGDDGHDKLYGDDGDDVIYGGNGNDTIYGGNGNDTLSGDSGNNVIYTGSGDDVILCNDGNNKIYSESGNNQFEFDCLEHGNDTVYGQTPPRGGSVGNDSIIFSDSRITSINDLNFVVKGNDLIINYKDTDDGSVTLANYLANPSGSSIKYICNKIYNPMSSDYDICNLINIPETNNTLYDLLNNGCLSGSIKLEQDYSENTSRGVKIVGTPFANEMYGGTGNDTIIGGKNYDEVIASSGNDNYTLGTGCNTVTYDFADGINFGTDTINLTKDEKLLIELKNSSSIDIIVDNIGNDAVLDCYDLKTFKLVGKIVIKNYYTKDVVGENGYVKISYNGTSNYVYTRDIDELYETHYVSKNNKGVITGSRFDDLLNISSESSNTTVNLGDGNNSLYGSLHNEIVTAGTGNDTIKASAGADTYTLGKGTNRITYDFSIDSDFGTDTINLTKDENLEIEINNALKIEYGASANLKDCVLKLYKNSNQYSTLIIKNYYATDVVGLNGSVKIIQDGLESDLSSKYDLNIYSEYDFNSKGVFNGSRFIDDVTATNVLMNTTINVGEGNNKVTGSYYNDVINAGNGKNNITEYSGTNRITTGKGADVFILSGTSINNIKAGDGDNEFTIGDFTQNTITAGNNDDKVTVNGGLNNINLGNGNNDIIVNEGSNTITTGTGNDSLIIGSTTSNMYDLSTKINTGTGNDEIIIQNGINNITLGCNLRVDKVPFFNLSTVNVYGHNAVTITGDSINTITGSAGIDVFDIQATNSVNIINSGAGDDIFSINGGNNIITASAGDNYFTITDANAADIYTNIVTGGGSDHFYIASNTSKIEADINSGAGNDEFYFAEGNNLEVSLDGGKGNDKYDIQNIDFNDNDISITDKFGNNELIISNAMWNNLNDLNNASYAFDSSNYMMLFNVKLDKRGNAISDLSNVIITKDIDFNSDKQFDSTLTINGGLNNFNIKNSNGDTLTIDTDRINTITQCVGNWLKGNNYTSVAEAFEDKNSDINSLIQYFAGVED